MSDSLLNRRRNTPWIQRKSRLIIGAIALLGIINTTYLTVTKLMAQEAVCPTSGCEQVLSSAYATVFGLPLSLYGLMAYVTMAALALGPLAVNPKTNKTLRLNLEDLSWLGIFALSTAMVVFSGYLMYIMFSQFVVPMGAVAICYYCLASALFALTLFVLSLVGRAWEDVGQLIFIGVIVGMVTLITTLGVYSGVSGTGTIGSNSNTGAEEQKFIPGVGLTVMNRSSQSEIELAKHLKNIGAKMYGAYTCPHCHDQKELFGREAAKLMPYVECAPDGKNSQYEACIAANVPGFPTWVINGKQLVGTQSLETLANESGYTGPRNFQNTSAFLY